MSYEKALWCVPPARIHAPAPISGKIKLTFTDIYEGYSETETVSSIKYELEKK